MNGLLRVVQSCVEWGLGKAGPQTPGGQLRSESWLVSPSPGM